MREILYRAKCIDNGEWVYGVPIKEALVGSHDGYYPKMIPECDGRHQTVYSTAIKEETLEQYTGLKDKNNVKAFEGDIVACNQSGSCGISVIIYDNSAFYVMPLNGNILERTLWDYWYNDWDIEVIGNIHDNPELLEGEK